MTNHTPQPHDPRLDNRDADPLFWSAHTTGPVTVLRFHRDSIRAAVNLNRIMTLWDFFDGLLAGPHRILHIDFAADDMSHDGLVRLWEYFRDIASAEYQRAQLELAREDVAMQRFIGCVRDSKLFVVGAFRGEIDINFLGLLLACDYVIVSDDSVIVKGEHPLGASLGTAVPWFLKRVLNPGPLLNLLLTDEQVSARRAYEMGLFHRLTSPDSHTDDALEITHTLAARGEENLLALKWALNASAASLDEYLRIVGAGFNRMPIRSFVCIHCGYNLTGNTSGTCPECGRATSESVDHSHIQRHKDRRHDGPDRSTQDASS